MEDIQAKHHIYVAGILIQAHVFIRIFFFNSCTIVCYEHYTPYLLKTFITGYV